MTRPRRSSRLLSSLLILGAACGLNAHVLYGNEHQAKATNLATALGEKVGAVATYTGATAAPASTDTTLTIWGHGGPDSFAEMTAAQLNTLIRKWKTKNPSLTTVELITCDARHLEGDTDSFTDKLMPLLIANGKVLVNVKGLPRGGAKATVSLLYAVDTAGSDGFYFIAAETNAEEAKARAILSAAEAAVPPATPVATKFLTAIEAAKKENDKAAMKGALKYTVSGGPFSKLRDRLAVVTSYKEGDKIKAVPKTLG